MKKWLIGFMLLIPLVLAACNSDSKDEEVDKNTDPVDPESLEVKVEILTPETLAVNEKAELSAKVTQNNEAVNDADVQFEVWESGFRDKGQMIKGTFDKDGVYKGEITFDHDGVYYMYAHTNARGMHVMPKQKLIVGKPDMSKVVEDKSDDSMEHMNESGNDNNSSEHSDSTQNNHSSNHNDSSSKNNSTDHNNNSHSH